MGSEWTLGLANPVRTKSLKGHAEVISSYTTIPFHLDQGRPLRAQIKTVYSKELLIPKILETEALRRLGFY